MISIMELNSKSQIKYIIQDKNSEVVTFTIPLEMIEGTRNFYDTLKEGLKDTEDFDIESSSIIKRYLILGEGTSE